MPKVVIEEFNKGSSSIVKDFTTKTGIGQTIHTLKVMPSNRSTPSESFPLSPSTNRPVVHRSEGSVKREVIKDGDIHV